MIVYENPVIGDLIGITYSDKYGNEVLQFGIFCGMDLDKYTIQEPHGNGMDAYYTYISGKLAKPNRK